MLQKLKILLKEVHYALFEDLRIGVSVQEGCLENIFM